MGAVGAVGTRLSALLSEWRALSIEDLRFFEGDATRLTLVMLIGLGLAMLGVRMVARGYGKRRSIGLPALLPALQRPSWAFVRLTPIAVLLIGLPWLALALADPHTLLRQREETFPGRRIALMIDASSSMVRPFGTPGLVPGATNSQAAFFTTIRAAERFVQLRTQGKYHDLMALVEFGDQAYVITPFTTDYDNLRLSLSLIGEFSEFLRFPDQGTVISSAVQQGVGLFEAFDFLDAAGNLMVLFSDGEDSSTIAEGTRVDLIVESAVGADVPIYFIRTRYGRELGTLVSDADWQAAVEKTGGRFYAGSDEASIAQAIRDIDRVGTGKIEVTQYVTQRPMFAPFTLIAAALWSTAVGLALTVPAFRGFP